MQSKTNVISLDKITVDKKLAKTTGFPEYRLVWRIVRQRVVDNIASVLDIDYLDKSLVPDMNREIGEHSIYAYFLAIIMAVGHSVLSVKLALAKRRDLALFVLCLTLGLLIILVIFAWSIIKIASLG